ncbi:MAG: helix-turn-helix domain-containing protein [Deltaproteobacteria bacterium]|nr:helix-turn-helix domain-containing protein [Deltaproteobacteria bacterium]
MDARPPEPLLTDAELAEILHVMPQTLARWRAAGRGPKWIRLETGLVRYDIRDVEAYLDAQRRCGGAPRAETVR